MTSHRAGFTLLEVLVASLITSAVAGGTMAAFVTAARISRAQHSPAYAEASALGEELLETFRNRVAVDDAFFASAPAGVWVNADPPANHGGTQSIQAQRRYRILPADCDGDGVVAGAGTPPELDCYQVEVKVCWAGTACP